LLAAQEISGDLVAPLVEPWKEPINVVYASVDCGPSLQMSSRDQVLLDCRRGERPVLVEVAPEVVEFLEVNGYLADRSDAAIAAAVSRFLVDSATG
jgi:hypothetical protein